MTIKSEDVKKVLRPSVQDVLSNNVLSNNISSNNISSKVVSSNDVYSGTLL
jgi:hypothetical protein